MLEKERLLGIWKTREVFLTLNPFMWVRIFPVVLREKEAIVTQ